MKDKAKILIESQGHDIIEIHIAGSPHRLGAILGGVASTDNSFKLSLLLALISIDVHGDIKGEIDKTLKAIKAEDEEE